MIGGDPPAPNWSSISDNIVHSADGVKAVNVGRGIRSGRPEVDQQNPAAAAQVRRSSSVQCSRLLRLDEAGCHLLLATI